MTAIPNLNRLLALLLATLTALSVTNNKAQSQESSTERLDYEVLQQLPHSNQNFTQGLFFNEGQLYESTGHYGQSKLIRYDTDFHTPLVSRSVSAKYFAEGATAHNDTIYQLTWQAGTALAYEPRRLGKKEGFSYQGEGWGLTSDGEYLWLSDGSDQIDKLDTEGSVISSIRVTANGLPLDRLNELEWIDGKIFANRWYDNRIFVINPTSGEVTGYLDLQELAQPEVSRSRENALNGVAWNESTKSLWVTGKRWSTLYELKLVD